MGTMGQPGFCSAQIPLAIVDSTSIIERRPHSSGIHANYVAQFTGKERDSETGLHYFGSRCYHGSAAKVGQPDPTFLGLNDPQKVTSDQEGKSDLHDSVQ
jgi:RHS repeat-associated protein